MGEIHARDGSYQNEWFVDDFGTLLAPVVDVLVILDDLAGDDFLCDVFVTSFVSARENTLTCKHLHDVFNESAVKCDRADSVQALAGNHVQSWNV